ncbi:MAG: chromosomal replication initiator protein DnaA [Bacilli bacterium]|nr:chromosomal replication initiator protein DnaA [Bacilli bacterium]
MKIETVWSSFLEEVQKQVNITSYQVWFKDLKLVHMDNKNITIQVPMPTHKTILGTTYYNIIQNIFLSLTGIEYDINFILAGENNFIDSVNNDIDNELEWKSNLNPNLTFENFVVGASNKLAFIAASAVAEAPGTIHNPLFIYGKSGLGKTHLMHAIGNFIMKNSNKKVLYVTSDEFMNDFTGIADVSKNSNTIDYANQFKSKYRNVDVLIIDDIQFLVGAEKTQQEFFNTFNYLHKTNKQIIISSDRSPDDLKKLEERLRSRFMWGLPVDIYPPDFELRCRIIKEKIKNTSIENKIDEDVIEYIANACPSDVRHIEGTINRLTACTAIYVPEKITLEFAIESLKDFVNKNVYVESSISKIQKIVADYFKITVDDMKGKKRTNNIAYPRQIAMYLCKMETDETLERIGLEFGGRDHSTVIFACDKIDKEIKSDIELVDTINKIKSSL